jgi:hypothetical protein
MYLDKPIAEYQQDSDDPWLQVGLTPQPIDQKLPVLLSLGHSVLTNPEFGLPITVQ